MAQKIRSSISSHPIQFCVISTVAIDTDDQYEDFLNQGHLSSDFDFH